MRNGDQGFIREVYDLFPFNARSQVLSFERLPGAPFSDLNEN
jgi:hypothetical protein